MSHGSASCSSKSSRSFMDVGGGLKGLIEDLWLRYKAKKE
jgi:hypothetical protein